MWKLSNKLILLLVCSSLNAVAQETAVNQSDVATQKSLTIDRIFAGEEFKEQRLGVFKWVRGQPAYLTVESAEGDPKRRQLVRVDCESGQKVVVATAAQLTPPGADVPLELHGFEFSDDQQQLLLYTNSQRVWRQNTRGDYWWLNLRSGQLKKLGGQAAPASMMFAKFSPDAQSVAFVRENNLYVQSLNDLQIRSLTNDGSATIINGTADWVNEEELEIRDGFRWSPDSRAIAFWQFDTAGVPEFTMIDNTSDKYAKTIRFAYPKVGQQNSAGRVGIASLDARTIRWMTLLGNSRENYIARMEWMPNGSGLILQQMNRLQNENRVLIADAVNGETRLAFVEKDAAWLENENPVRWIVPGKTLLWISELDGWRHAYEVDINTGARKCLTPGEFDVIQIEAIDYQQGWLYYAASPDQPTQRYLYRVKLSGGAAQRLTPATDRGWNTYDIHPDGQFALHTYSTFRAPPQTRLMRLLDHAVVRELVDNRSLRDALANLEMPESEFLRVNVGHDMPLDAWCLKPPKFDPQKQYPLLLYVYGEPHGQTVRDAWQGARGLWHMMLAQNGYVVASVDNRGTMSPRGRAWRKCVHRQIGILASQEQAAAVGALLDKWPFADRQRVGVWGWSGGGSMSLNAIFRYPQLYQVAVAVAPVPNQLLYDTIYQERYMGLPDDNAEGYQQGSPLTFAKQLQGDLLVIHGTGDDNCHYQGVELLINELVAHNKQFSVMPYPGRSHSISEGANTTRHFYSLITRYLKEHLRDRRSPPQADDLPGNKAASPAKSTSQIRWQTHEILGWQVNVHPRLHAEQADELRVALDLLTRQLEEIVRVVPPAAVAQLRQVPLWFSPEYGGQPPRAEYHPGRGWLVEHGRDPAMWRGVEFTNVRIFEAETRRMPNFALHELAHAFHDRVLGFDNADIEAAYRRAQASGRYEQVLRQDSEGNKSKGKAYAMVDPKEYFAETSEAFFSRNDFQPFDRGELQLLDPSMFQLLSTLWQQ